ncbi:MAG TPA: methyltransferase domain-containing protein [Myxococcota bacterium]|nr:methyltransferase domain-containing protein [Myxococcota bacterium]
MFVCPSSRGSLEEWYSNDADTLYPLVDGIPVLVPRPYDFLRRHGPWDPAGGVAGQRQELLGVESPDAVTPFLAPAGLQASGSFGDWLLDLGEDGPDAWLASAAIEHAPVGPCVDVGCGLGPMARLMHGLSRHVVCLDRSPDTMLLCRELLTGRLKEALVPTHRRGCGMVQSAAGSEATGFDFAIAEAQHPPLRKDSFAWVHLGFLIDGLEADDIVSALVASVELLGRGGILTLSTAYDSPPGTPHLPDEALPGPEMIDVVGELGLSVVDERDKVPHITRHYDRLFTVRLAHCLVLRRA